VPPPPVSGGAAGNAGATGADECVAGADECVAGADECVAGADVTPLWVGLGVAGPDARDEDGADARDEDGADALPRFVEVAPGDEPGDLEAWPGDGVRVPGWPEGCPCVGGAGAEIDGTAEPPPPVQAETVTARRNAPAAERPAISHALWAATGGISRIFPTFLECVSDKFAFPSGTRPQARRVP